MATPSGLWIARSGGSPGRPRSGMAFRHERGPENSGSVTTVRDPPLRAQKNVVRGAPGDRSADGTAACTVARRPAPSRIETALFETSGRLASPERFPREGFGASSGRHSARDMRRRSGIAFRGGLRSSSMRDFCIPSFLRGGCGWGRFRMMPWRRAQSPVARCAPTGERASPGIRSRLSASPRPG